MNKEIDFLHKVNGLKKLRLGLISDDIYKLIDANSRVIISFEVDKVTKAVVMRRWWLTSARRGWCKSKKGIFIKCHQTPSEGFFSIHKKEYAAILEREAQAEKQK